MLEESGLSDIVTFRIEGKGENRQVTMSYVADSPEEIAGILQATTIRKHDPDAPRGMTVSAIDGLSPENWTKRERERREKEHQERGGRGD